MTAGPHPDSPHPGDDHDDNAFARLMDRVLATEPRFGHRQHVQLTWLAVRHYGTVAAIGLVSDGIQRTARYAGAPQKYHATISRAWVELVGHHAGHEARNHSAAGFDAFAAANPLLLDKRLLTRFYRPATLAGQTARDGWVEPDLAPFPWQLPGAGLNG
jgi:hypothetical protein